MAEQAKSQYINYLQTLDGCPLFAESWWLDAVGGPVNWDVVSFHDAAKNNHAFIPYQVSRIRSMKAITTPPLTPWLPLIQSSGETEFPLAHFFQNIPHYSILDISLRHNQQIQFDAAEAKISSRYTFIIPSGESIEQVRSGYNEGLRRNLKQAEKNYSITVSEGLNAFIHLCKMTYIQREMQLPRSVERILPGVYNELASRGRGMITFALKNNVPVAGILTAWDHLTTYYLLGGRSADNDGASAHALLLDNAIQNAVLKNHAFDFEGSMHPGIANFFQSFGAVPEEFSRIRSFKGVGKIWGLFHI
jgi:hypothetical protein